MTYLIKFKYENLWKLIIKVLKHKSENFLINKKIERFYRL